MAELAGGAVLGVGVTEFWNKVKEVRHRVKDFNPQLEKLDETLEMLDQMIQDIRRTSTQLNEPDQVERLASILQKGNDLVSKGLGIKRWNLWKKYSHQMKLVELDNELLRFSIRQVPLRILLAVNQVRLEQRRDFAELLDQIVSLSRRSNDQFNAPNARETYSGIPTTLEPPPVPNTFPDNISLGSLILAVLLPLVPVIIKITAIVIIIYKVVTAVMSMLEKSGSGIWMVINVIGKLDMTIEQLNDTMESLDQVLEELRNEAHQSEAGESLRSLMEEGEKLVFESSSLRWWNFVKKCQYQMTIVELENKLLRFHSLYLQDRLAKNDDKTCGDDPQMKDNESFVPVHSGKDPHEMKGCLRLSDFAGQQKPSHHFKFERSVSTECTGMLKQREDWKQIRGDSLPVLMPGDEVPRFIAMPCPCVPSRSEDIIVSIEKPLPNPPSVTVPLAVPPY
ncbi:hypothetical protein QN277_007419 [Acacia crassicarpa]|uniref:RPW8 domain-containing protein n=1 Tax=Acacia crassicarpa TaxID=499986 RepID=A0AAE1M9Y6_9FABA|nr:hypothetical protein QN277_007419 [Acacia crassicarpa]